MCWLLYIVTILLDTLPLVLRFLLVTGLLGPVAGTLAAVVPLAWSLATAAGIPSGGWWTRWQHGARRLSQREQDTLDAAWAILLPPTERPPKRVFVIDAPTVEARVIGTSLYLDRELLHTPDLVPVLAHELGHLGNGDGRLALAVERVLCGNSVYGTCKGYDASR